MKKLYQARKVKCDAAKEIEIMKLKDSFVTHMSDGTQIMVDTTGSFSGLIRNNKTAAFIVECLKEDTTKEAIVKLMNAKYNASCEIIERDVSNILDTLRKVGALEE